MILKYFINNLSEIKQPSSFSKNRGAKSQTAAIIKNENKSGYIYIYIYINKT
jgi:hypothetical protein